jgi:hypothetical protein
MIVLKATTETLEVVTSSTAQLDYTVTFVDVTSTTFTPSTTEGVLTSAATAVLLTAPAASTQRQVKLISINNRSTTVANTVRVQKDISTVEYWLSPNAVLAPGERLQYTSEMGWAVFDINGRQKVNNTPETGLSGRSIGFVKAGTAAKAAATMYCFGKDGGYPGAWAPGTPGVAGRATDGTTTTDGGCLPFINAASGSMYLTDAIGSVTVACAPSIYDVLWVNSGLTVTTTTAQSVASVAWPARDANGSTNGQDVQIGILVTTVLGNAGAVTNCTVDYTNSDGTAARTATTTLSVFQIPITAVVGCFIPLALQAGDRGVRSIQNITLGTSLVSGAISLIAYRPLVNLQGQVNLNSPPLNMKPGIKLYNGTCMLPFYLATATTALTFSGTVTVQER